MTDHEEIIVSRLCGYQRCDKEFIPRRDDQRFCSASCRSAAAREKALTGPGGKITGGPRKNKRGTSITVLFTGDDAERALRLNPGEFVHVYPATDDSAGEK